MVRRRRRAIGVAARAIGLVADLPGAGAAAVGGDRGAPQVLDGRQEQALWPLVTRGLAGGKIWALPNGLCYRD